MTNTTESHGDPTWFARLFGAPEADWPTTQARFRVEGEALHSLVNDRCFAIGRFATPTLAELRRETLALEGAGTLRVSHEVIGDVLPLHAEPANRGATFQVASQFNCLEFVSPDVTPEDGVTGYAFDGTQGPACALAAAAGTVFRNYAVPVGGAFGQRHDRQLDNLAEITARVPGIHTRNGYTRATPAALAALRDLVRDPLTRDTLLTSVQVGVQSRVGVTFAARWREPDEATHVTQVFASAVSCAYERAIPLDTWEPLARLVLEAAYEATLRAAARDLAEGRGSGRVWLTQLGGGVFGNRPEWIVDAMARAVARCRGLALDVRVCHHRRLDAALCAGV